MGGHFISDLVWEQLFHSLLTAFRFWLEFRKSFFWHCFDFFPTCYVMKCIYVQHAVGMAVDVIVHYVHRCRSHDMSSFSYISKRKTGPSFLTPHFDVGLRITYSMWWIQHRPHLTIQAAVVRHAPELQCKGIYDTRREWIAIHFILHSAIGPTTWSVSCCRPAVLPLAVILLLYCRIHSYTAWLPTINRYCIVYLNLIRFFVRSDDLLRKYRLWPTRHWGG